MVHRSNQEIKMGVVLERCRDRLQLRYGKTIFESVQFINGDGPVGRPLKAIRKFGAAQAQRLGVPFTDEVD
jgi:hypothetical protein